MREWKWGVAAAVDVTLLGRYYERFADHAVEVAQRVIFLATGEYAASPDDDPQIPEPSSEELVRRFNQADRDLRGRLGGPDGSGRIA